MRPIWNRGTLQSPFSFCSPSTPRTWSPKRVCISQMNPSLKDGFGSVDTSLTLLGSFDHSPTGPTRTLPPTEWVTYNSCLSMSAQFAIPSSQLALSGSTSAVLDGTAQHVSETSGPEPQSSPQFAIVESAQTSSLLRISRMIPKAKCFLCIAWSTSHVSK